MDQPAYIFGQSDVSCISFVDNKILHILLIIISKSYPWKTKTPFLLMLGALYCPKMVLKMKLEVSFACIHRSCHRQRTHFTIFIFKVLHLQLFEPPHGKTNNLHRRKQKTQISFAVTAKLISAFVFTTRIVQFLFYLNLKFQASNSFLLLVCAGRFVSNLWGNHIVGFSMRRLIYC